MEKNKVNRIVVVCGPTATGKTSLALRLAKEFGGELVNFDSRQVYQGMDIGTGKDLPENSKFKVKNLKLDIEQDKHQIGYYLFGDIPVWLLDIVSPDYRFSAGDYLQCAEPVLENILSQGKLPILVGGTGFYLQVLEEEIESLGVKPDWPLRRELEQLSVLRLQDKLKKANQARFNRMNRSDRLNSRRLIRAIEVAQSDKQFFYTPPLSGKSLLKIGLVAPQSFLNKKINQRITRRLQQGLLEEIAALIKAGYNFDNSVLGETIAYQEWQECFEESQFITPDKRQKQKIVQKWRKNEQNYAKRQITWFKKRPAIDWFSVNTPDWQGRALSKVGKWYNKSDESK